MANPTVAKLAEWHHVASISYLGPVRFRTLLEQTDGRVGRIFDLPEARLKDLKGVVTSQVIKGIEKSRDGKQEAIAFAEEQLELAAGFGVRILLLDDPEYPRFFRESKMCHPIIFCKGNLTKFRDYSKAIAVVGTRNPLPRSQEFASLLAHRLAHKGWVVVSGMAKGIDTLAHKAALDAKGKTIAVLGSGVDKPYPRENLELYEEILHDNLVVSEYPLGSKPEALRLKKRNKTTVAYSCGAVAVQSTKDGGTMNAYRACIEQGKPVFTISSEGDDFSGNREILEGGGIQLAESSAIQTIEDACSSWTDEVARQAYAGMKAKSKHKKPKDDGKDSTLV